MPPRASSLEALPEDILSRVFEHLHQPSRGNPAFALAQCSRALLAVFARTALREVRHAPPRLFFTAAAAAAADDDHHHHHQSHAAVAHTARLLRTAGDRLRTFALHTAPPAVWRGPGGRQKLMQKHHAAPVLLDVLAECCRKLRVLEIAAAKGSTVAPFLLKKVLCLCAELEEVRLVDPSLDVLSALVRAGVESGGTRGGRVVVVRLGEDSAELMEEVGKALGRDVREVEMKWSRMGGGAEGGTLASGGRLTGSLDGVSDEVEGVGEGLEIVRKLLVDLASRPQRREPKVRDLQALSEGKAGGAAGRWVLSNSGSSQCHPCAGMKPRSMCADVTL